MKKWGKILAVVAVAVLAISVAAFAQPKNWVVGVSQTGSGPVLQEAKRAGIPVVMIDRDVAKQDQGLRLTIMGSDFVKEGEKAGEWLADYLKKKGIDDGRKNVN